jgi:hypothetical protein
MRLPFAAAALLAPVLIACSGPKESASGTGPEKTPIETPEHATSSPTNAPLTPKGPENTLVETPEYAGIIVSEQGASEFGYLFDQASTSFWEPSFDDVWRAEERVRKCLVSARDEPKLDTYQRASIAFILENLEEYRRQYVGIDVDGEKRIWINAFFSDDLHVDWQRVPVDVDGGGKYYWQIEYRPLKDECVDFRVHGES